MESFVGKEKNQHFFIKEKEKIALQRKADSLKWKRESVYKSRGSALE